MNTNLICCKHVRQKLFLYGYDYIMNFRDNFYVKFEVWYVFVIPQKTLRKFYAQKFKFEIATRPEKSLAILIKKLFACVSSTVFQIPLLNFKTLVKVSINAVNWIRLGWAAGGDEDHTIKRKRYIDWKLKLLQSYLYKPIRFFSAIIISSSNWRKLTWY